jgi:transcriptional regulator with XRE-family HTH domain
MRELGERLRGFRLENGWSKRTVARRLGVSTPSIIRWEEGIARPNDYNRYKIERLLAKGGDGVPAASPASHPTHAQNGMR